MAGARVTLIGSMRQTTSPTARARFLARHPSATGYADFPDFAFYALLLESAHFIGGFGRIVDLPPERSPGAARWRRGTHRGASPASWRT